MVIKGTLTIDHSFGINIFRLIQKPFNHIENSRYEQSKSRPTLLSFFEEINYVTLQLTRNSGRDTSVQMRSQNTRMVGEMKVVSQMICSFEREDDCEQRRLHPTCHPMLLN